MRLHNLADESLLHILIKDNIANNPMVKIILMHITEITTEAQYEDFVTSKPFKSFVSDVTEFN